MYQTEIQTFSFDSINVSVEKVTNIDELFEKLLAKGEQHDDVLDERIPYWAELWPSALALSRYITTLELNWQELRVHEIGAGLGLPSIVAGKMGATVTVSDYLPEALHFAESNWKRNNCGDAEFRMVDWRFPADCEPADILLAADIAYEQRMFRYLPDTFRKLCKKNGRIILSEPNRAFAQPFLSAIANEGFKLEHKIAVAETLDGQKYKINILDLRIL